MMNKLMKVSALGYMLLLTSTAFADNAVQMVTYFPVPYAAYNNVFVSEKLDVGTQKGAFTLNLGNADCNSTSLKANAAYLRKVTAESALSFDTDIYTGSATFGNTEAKEQVLMQIDKLRINKLNDATHAVQDVKATNFTVHGNMYMIENAFETGKAALPKCEGTVTWQKLTIAGQREGYYLVCVEDE